MISWLRTGHVNVKKYMKRIGRSKTDECECMIEEQLVEHVLLRYALAEEARGRADEAIEGDLDIVKLLYTEEGMEWALVIWSEFEKDRRERRERQNEQEGRTKNEAKIWGMGDL